MNGAKQIKWGLYGDLYDTYMLGGPFPGLRYSDRVRWAMGYLWLVDQWKGLTPDDMRWMENRNYYPFDPIDGTSY